MQDLGTKSKQPICYKVKLQDKALTDQFSVTSCPS